MQKSFYEFLLCLKPELLKKALCKSDAVEYILNCSAELCVKEWIREKYNV